MTTTTALTVTDVADVLDKAATVIESNGLHKGSLYRKQRGKARRRCAVCAQGALNIAATGSPLTPSEEAVDPGHPNVVGWHFALVISANQALTYYAGIEDVPAWSDAPERTASDVVTAFRAVEDALRKEVAA
ncbi:hypothetical protein [Streptomyces sp. MZ04]|uniref:DUF6197 family protein n=1 Tax=Streptomyces sp. MZ04 TaxID=2559236 RepID=UPI00107ED7F6|nr:hypothetical protein [Streptomyces sp. MZ04]TGB11589.1 hypothetical protein E2651_12990 [Streptomyces sp. MZ04]